MAHTNGVKPIDIFNALTPAEKRKVLKLLQQSEQTPCERLGHKLKAVNAHKPLLFSRTIVTLTCERCGHTIHKC
jgi:predicted nucleic acid-binding Zn ribbon protein